MNINNLYTDLVKEYNREQWFKICSLDRFLQVKAESALKKGNGNLYNAILDVIAVADNDY